MALFASCRGVPTKLWGFYSLPAFVHAYLINNGEELALTHDLLGAVQSAAELKDNLLPHTSTGTIDSAGPPTSPSAGTSRPLSGVGASCRTALSTDLWPSAAREVPLSCS